MVCFCLTAKYKLPQALFGSHIRASTVLSAMESIAADTLEIPEACGIHSSLEVSTLHMMQYILGLFGGRQIPVSSQCNAMRM